MEQRKTNMNTELTPELLALYLGHMATNITELQQYPKAWEAAKQFGTQEFGLGHSYGWEEMLSKPYPFQQGVFEAFGRSRGYRIEYMQLETEEHDFDIYKGSLWVSNAYNLDHPTAHFAAVKAMFELIEKEEAE